MRSFFAEYFRMVTYLLSVSINNQVFGLRNFSISFFRCRCFRNIVLGKIELGLLTFDEALHAEVCDHLLFGLLFESLSGDSCHRPSSESGLCVLIHSDWVLLLGDVGGSQFGQHNGILYSALTCKGRGFSLTSEI